MCLADNDDNWYWYKLCRLLLAVILCGINQMVKCFDQYHTTISDDYSPPSYSAISCNKYRHTLFIALHRYCAFFVFCFLYQLKARPSTNKTIRTCYVVTLALLCCSEVCLYYWYTILLLPSDQHSHKVPSGWGPSAGALCSSSCKVCNCMRS